MRERTGWTNRSRICRAVENEFNDSTGMIELAEAEGEKDLLKEAEASLAIKPRRGHEARIDAVGRGRRQRRLSRNPRGRGRHRVPGLGIMLFRMYTRWAERKAINGSCSKRARVKRRVSNRRPSRSRAQRLRMAQDRDRRTSSGAHLALRFQRAASYELYVRWCFSGDRRQDRDRYSRQGRAHRRLSRERRGRTARQQDGMRGTHHPFAHQHRRAVPSDRSQHKNRATAWNMLRARIYEAELKKREDAAQAENAREPISVGAIRSVVCAAALSAGEGSAHGSRKPRAGDVLDGELDPFMAASLPEDRRRESGISRT